MNKLERLAEFQKILADYRVSEDSKKILQKTELVLLVASSSTGRNTIIHELQKTEGYHFLVSDTTRKPRINNGVLEKNGVEYWFRSEQDVLADLRKGKFLEAAIIHNQQVSGISIRELEKARDEQKIAITDIEIVGVHNVMKAKGDAKAIFVLPPSFEEWQNRLRGRGKMHGEEYRRRLESALKEFAAGLENEYYMFIINDRVTRAANAIRLFAQEGRVDRQEQLQARQLAKELYDRTRTFLEN